MADYRDRPPEDPKDADPIRPPERRYVDPKVKLRQEPPTTGHTWDGIEEYDNPMPRWWLWTFYATIVFALIYTIAYPAWPMISRATPGLLGYSSREQVAQDIERFDQRNADIVARLTEVDLTEIADDPELNSFATQAGASVFHTWCAQCHGSGGAGVQAAGYPNLLDDAWLWGGTIEEIHYTVSHGIRNEDDPDARYSQMPAFGDMLSDEEIDQTVAYVRQMSGQTHDADMAAAGEEIYLSNCASCHGDDGGGNQALGAPTLSDAIWLYGGDENSIRHTIVNARFGIMPPWTDRLTEAEIRSVATYVHQLGGGQ